LRGRKTLFNPVQYDYDTTSNRALKSREISREDTGIFTHMWHQASFLGVNSQN